MFVWLDCVESRHNSTRKSEFQETGIDICLTLFKKQIFKNPPLCLDWGSLFRLHPVRLCFLPPSILLLLLLWYLLPELVVDPQGLLQPETAAYAGHLSAQGAGHGEEPPSDLRYGPQAGLTEGVPAVEHPGDPVPAGVRQEADAALSILTQDHLQTGPRFSKNETLRMSWDLINVDESGFQRVVRAGSRSTVPTVSQPLKQNKFQHIRTDELRWNKRGSIFT